MIKVYLAGRIDEKNLTPAYEWREYASELLLQQKMRPINPMKNLVYKDAVTGKVQRHEYINDFDYIYHQDIQLLEDSNYLLVNMTDMGEGFGTTFEIGYATALDIPVYGYAKDFPDHLFINNAVNIKPSITDCVDAIMDDVINGVLPLV